MSCGCKLKKGQAGYGKGKAKPLSAKQKTIAKKAGDPKKIGADDLAALRNKKAGK
jgi:hypothetical protein